MLFLELLSKIILHRPSMQFTIHRDVHDGHGVRGVHGEHGVHGLHGVHGAHDPLYDDDWQNKEKQKMSYHVIGFMDSTRRPLCV